MVTVTARRGGRTAIRVPWRALAGATADAAGYLARAVLAVVRVAWNVLPMVLVSAGAWWVYAPAGPITLGLLLLADRAIDARGRP